jgi:amino acid adenylation domain-containing protein
MTDPIPSSNLKDRAALEAMLLGNAARSADSRSGDNHAKPLSPAQEGLWFLGQLSPTLPVYNVPQTFSISGPLNIPAFERALTETVNRHDALRTRIVVRDQKPFQELWPAERFKLKIEDLSSTSPTARTSIVKGIIQEDATRTFDLQKEPLVRTKLIKLGPDQLVFSITVHHIVADMWSLGILYEELSANYLAFANNEAPTLPPAPSFQRFACEQFEAAATQDFSKEMAYWRQIIGSSSVLELPVDFTRPKEPGFKGAIHWFRVSEEVTTDLTSLSRKNNASLYMTLLAAFQVLLQNYSRQNDFVIGTPFSQRDFPDAERMVGYMINMLALKADGGGNPNFEELLQRVRTGSLAAYEHQNMPFNRIVEELRLNREPGQNPLCQVVFQYLPNGVAKLELPGAKTEAITIDTGTAKFDLTLTFATEGSGLIAEIEYNTDLFERSTIERLARNFNVLLSAISKTPSARIGDLPLLSPEEETLLLREWNNTATPYPNSATIAQLFEEQVAAGPNRTALLNEMGSLSYHELNHRANVLAHRLIESGVASGTPVGVCIERSFDLVIALLAILKAGGAYVPFDPNYPTERILHMFKDSNVKLLLTDEAFRGPVADHVRKINIRAPFTDAALQETNPAVAGSPQTLAYIMYTSGSTGEPKGVAVPNQAVVRLVKNTNFADLNKDEVFLLFAPISFDASTLELWGPLLNGAALAVYPPVFESLEQFERILNLHHVTTLWLTSGLFNFVVDHNASTLRGVRQLLVGGDVLSVEHVKKAISVLPGTQLINGYGPTENTTFTCCYKIPKNFKGERTIPIGRPISNTTVYILDEHQRPVPIGVPGELLTGGDGLALGYWNQPELTSQKFIRNPFAEKNRERLYRTGDLARYLEDGTIEFLGRLDNQVKIRGFRIELGEIEAALNKQRIIQNAVVTVRRETGGVNSLAAYVVPAYGSEVDVQAVRNELARVLPGYMVPAYITSIQKLPLNANGKVDRAALPPPCVPQTAQETALPANAIEEQIAGIWKNILDVPELGVNDNFFELGGHSLLATRVISRVNQTFNVNLSIAALFQTPTIRTLADRVASGSQNGIPMGNRTTSTGDSALLGRLDEMSDAEVDALLENMLPGQ